MRLQLRLQSTHITQCGPAVGAQHAIPKAALIMQNPYQAPPIRERRAPAKTYKDPTGDSATRNADKDKNKRKTRRPRRGVELRGQVIEVPTVELDTLLPG